MTRIRSGEKITDEVVLRAASIIAARRGTTTHNAIVGLILEEYMKAKPETGKKTFGEEVARVLRNLQRLEQSRAGPENQHSG